MRAKSTVMVLAVCAPIMAGAAERACAGILTIDYPGAASTYAYGISGDTVVGSYYDGSNHGFVYDGSTYTTISYPGAFGTYARGISGGKIVGYYDAVGGGTHGFLYNGSTYATLDYPGATRTQVYGISGNDIVGEYYDGSSHGFVYDGSTFTSINHPGATSTRAYGVSGNNIVGSYIVDHGGLSLDFHYDGSTFTSIDYPGPNPGNPQILYTYIWNGHQYTHVQFDNGTRIEIKGAIGETQDATLAKARRAVYGTLENEGAFGIYGSDIVGFRQASADSDLAFLYDGLTYTTLLIPESLSTYAYGISGDDIVGSYHVYGGTSHGFLADRSDFSVQAVPLPGSVLLGVWAVGLAGCRLRRRM